MKILLANPRGFCAGVDRAIDIVELALDVYGPPVYVKHAIVHNVHVVKRLEAKGARFIETVEEIPEGSRAVFSAHGSPVEDYVKAKARRLELIDATCPLVTKVHLEAKRFAREGCTIIFVGHRGHPEPIGTMSEAPNKTFLIERADEVDSLVVPDPNRVALLTQTTLSVDDTRETVEAVKRKFPNVAVPPRGDICYATTNRQQAAKELAKRCDLVLVVGSATSSNTNRLVEVARVAGATAYRIDDASEIDPAWLATAKTVGVTSGASVPDDLVQGVVAFLRERGASSVETLDVIHEKVFFGLPPSIAAGARTLRPDHAILKKHAVVSGTTMKV